MTNDEWNRRMTRWWWGASLRARRRGKTGLEVLKAVAGRQRFCFVWAIRLAGAARAERRALPPPWQYGFSVAFGVDMSGAWIYPCAADCRMPFLSGLPREVGFSSPSNACRNQLCGADVGDAVLASVRHNHDKLVWHCRLCLLMPDHLHGIIAFPREPGMKTTVTNWKRYVATHHPVEWQRDFFDHRLRNAAELEEKTSYILMNPVRKGLCEPAEDWMWVYRPNDCMPSMLGY
jgi:putative transposase